MKRIDVTSPKYALQRSRYVFVYGTLKKSCHNNGLLRKAKYVGKGITTKKFRLFDLGSYPAVIPSEKGYFIKGEVYEIPSESIMRSLDWLEGYPTYYKRQVIKVELPDKKKNVEAWIYYMNTPIGKEITPKDKKNAVVEWKCK